MIYITYHMKDIPLFCLHTAKCLPSGENFTHFTR